MRTALVAALALLLIAIPATANAMFTRTSAGSGLSLSTGTLGTPRNVSVPSASSGSVAVSWTAPSGAPSSTSYYVTHTTGSTTSAACGTSASNLITATSCTDTVTSNGSYTYAVTAVFHRWTATSAASSTVVVTANVGALVFSQSPQSTKSDQTLGTVIVQLHDNAGNNVNTSGVRVTLSLSNNSEGATLAGTLSQTTGSTGNATFSGLSVDLVGSYTLTATATGFSAGTSVSFTITAGQAADLTLVSGSPQSGKKSKAFSSPLVVRVTDAEGNPVAGTTVSFTAPSSGASGVFSNNNNAFNATSDSTGQASVTFTANSTTGTYSVVAAGGGDQVSFSLTNTA